MSEAKKPYRMSPGAKAAQARIRAVAPSLRRTMESLPGYQEMVKNLQEKREKQKSSATEQK
ncbi:MAG: hypothetical protein ACTHNH_21225 [Mesorhizobium sp.]